jgi:hypothetical protein
MLQSVYVSPADQKADLDDNYELNGDQLLLVGMLFCDKSDAKSRATLFCDVAGLEAENAKTGTNQTAAIVHTAKLATSWTANYASSQEKRADAAKEAAFEAKM